MQRSPLTTYLLENSIVDFTKSLVGNALLYSTPALQERNTRTAKLALKFFLDILDPAIPDENIARANFQRYLLALDDPYLATQISDQFFGTISEDVLQLPEGPASSSDDSSTGFEEIFRHLPIRSQDNADRYDAWNDTQDLSTIERQVRFGFEATISDSAVGQRVRALKLAWIHGSWNGRLVLYIASLTPQLRELAIHWGDAHEQEAPTNASVNLLHQILSRLPNLTTLKLIKLSYTPPSDQPLSFPHDAPIPFTRLESLSMHEFHWYFDPISRGIGPNLRTLDVGYATNIPSDRITTFLTPLTNLETLRTSVALEPIHYETIVQAIPGLQRVDVTQLGEVDTSRVIPLLMTLQQLREISLSFVIDPASFEAIIHSPAPLEIISLTLYLTPNTEGQLIQLLHSKRRALKFILISFVDRASTPTSLRPSDAMIHALAQLPQLEDIIIDFDNEQSISPSAVETLLTGCRNLKLTECLESLVTGNPLYEREYKDRMEREMAEEELESS